MAYDVKKVNPLDTQPRKGVGIGLPFSNGNPFSTTYSTQEALKANLLDLLLTGSGERYINPTFGSTLFNYLFENMTESTLRRLKEDLTQTIKLYFPRIIINSLEIQTDGNSNTLNIDLSYRVSETDIEDEIGLTLEI